MLVAYNSFSEDPHRCWVLKLFKATFGQTRKLSTMIKCRSLEKSEVDQHRGMWNNLPDEFKSITNLDVFKVKIKQHFLRVFLKN